MSQNTSATPSTPRVPHAAQGVDVNFCRNPKCENFGVPIPQGAQRGRGASNPYTVVAKGKNIPAARCNACGEHITLKSNSGVLEESLRILAAHSRDASCPEPLCSNHRVPLHVKGAYHAIGTTRLGSRRYRCLECKGSFSVKPEGINPIRNQRQSDKNRTILSMLTNKMPLRRICEAADVTPGVLYDRIDFLSAQAEAFLAERERGFHETDFDRLYIGTDRQIYVANWTRREDKRNVPLEAVASADNRTGYVFGMHVNFDPEQDPDAVNAAALAAGDLSAGLAHRRFARLWLQSDFDAAVASGRKVASKGGLVGDISAAYANAILREDTEASDLPVKDDKLPGKGMLVHSEYTLHGHFITLRRLLGGTDKVRFFLDQESGIRGACIGAFADRILEDRCEAFYVRIAKEITVDEKRKLIGAAKADFAMAKAAMIKEGLEALREEFFDEEDWDEGDADITDRAVELTLLKQRIAAAQAMGPWKDRWVAHPLPTLSEAEKGVCHLTDRGQYDDDADHLAWLYRKASLHAVDSFFNRLRRRFTMLERPVSSQANRGRVWNGYSAYRPEQIGKLLTIARACHNYVWTGDKKKGVDPSTPAMRLGQARAPLDLNDIIYFK